MFSNTGSPSVDYWIGAQRYVDSGQFVQTFGPSFGSTGPFWKPGQPSKTFPGFCAKAMQDTSYKLDDRPCSETHYIVCQIEHSVTV